MYRSNHTDSIAERRRAERLADSLEKRVEAVNSLLLSLPSSAPQYSRLIAERHSLNIRLRQARQSFRGDSRVVTCHT